MPKNRPAPLRVRQCDAAATLGVDSATFGAKYDHLFTDTRPRSARGSGKIRWVLTDELNLLLAAGEAALIEYRRERGRLRGAR
jgi:hypothetical protein